MTFDFGDSKLAVAIVKISNHGIETVAIDGDMNLGGRDCDEALMEFCLKEYIKEYKEENDNNDPKITARIKEKFKQAARELKIDLSSD